MQTSQGVKFLPGQAWLLCQSLLQETDFARKPSMGSLFHAQLLISPSVWIAHRQLTYLYSPTVRSNPPE
jgi:hypothetical protein